jgi:glycosyltransferase involved in cell wall biosynthesis
MPVYAGDEPRFLDRAFESTVESQTVRPSEVVLVQDGPVPGQMALKLANIVGRSPVPVRLVTIEHNKGLATALTEGMAECKYEVIARMDADDVSDSQRFETQIKLIASGLDLVGSGMYEFTEEDGVEQIVGQRTPPTGTEAIARYSRFHDPFNHPTVVFRRQAVEKVGGYQHLGMMEDYWLFARMIHAGLAVANVPEPLVHYRVSSGAFRRRGGLKQLRSEWQIQRAFLRIGFTSPAQFARNSIVRSAYRVVPERVRRIAYRRLIAHGNGAAEGWGDAVR